MWPFSSLERPRTASPGIIILRAVLTIAICSQFTAAHNVHSSWTSHSLLKRQAQYQYIADEADPVKAASDIQQMPGVPGNFSEPPQDQLIIQGDGSESNPSWLSQVPFVATPTTNITTLSTGKTGWQWVPDMEGFTLNRTWHVLPNAIMPFYATTNYRPGEDNSAIKRAIITMPGKPRDSWKYANLFRNALAVAASNASNGVNPSEVLIVGPVFLNSDDKESGAVHDGELYWHGSQWQSGHRTRNDSPRFNLSSYHILDNLTDWLFLSSEFPGLKSVVIAGHSMGAQAVQRYTLLKKTKKYDPNLHFWIGNPGSWAWLDDQRPYQNASCGEFDKWGYGITNVSSVVGYARRDVNASREEVVQRYRTRKVHYALGLLDWGQGDTHCQASMQGGSHLDRGSQFVLALDRQGGFPASHTLDVIEGTSHQDYPMIRADKSIRRIFLTDYNTSYPFLDNVTNPGDHHHHNKTHDPHHPKEKKFNTPTHRIIATALLAGSIGFVLLFFTALPFIFTPNYNDREYKIEMELRRKLL
ncbi:hypothetical protein BCV70DRAFT_218521 [Testicularia cyperi]|uniref:Alpha/beta-hydrolase n=1 Tax=Testicularia cyperi TaxID=1882483 RepID=A0A317XKY8_9BASI|nr:hypothetical protein BCV70DRAFT_218521 [Testicularia cyperi]